jgi:hypothetical protein
MARTPHTRLSQPLFQEPTFGEGGPSHDPTAFSVPHPSDSAIYKQIGNLAKKNVVPVPPSRQKPDELFSLETAYGKLGPQVIAQINKANCIAFHTFGDSGASNARKYFNELRVADQVTIDSASARGAYAPAAFLYHLGDIVYNFGEAQYYYDQFYEPFRNYPAPIFAIPGNHDSFVVPGTKAGQAPLTTFQRNFCSPNTVITPEAGSLHRTAMIQPGVYFTLDAPFVRIIGLFSNALEDPGVISNISRKWPKVSNIQIDFLRAQLNRIKQEKYPGAVILAMHHPPFSYSPRSRSGGAGGNHGSSTEMLKEIDTVCHDVGVYPHAVLSGHAHNYQRYTRLMAFGSMKEIGVPFIVCGDGGHNVNPLVQPHRGEQAQDPHAGSDVTYLEGPKPVAKVHKLILAKYDDHNYGYLRVDVDKQYLKIGFHQVGTRTAVTQSRFDMVTVRLADRHLVAN